ncbi:MAG TPA: cytochrome c maturation protein CcmE [Acidimicrobiales bacterium]|nr:cytochrome c maturation protein CcmE [Acidimicrobiales bacterium]
MALTTGSPPNNSGAGEAAGRPAVPSAPRVVHRRTFLGSRRRQIVAGVIIVGAVAFLLFQGLGNATEYFKTADQAVADRAALGTRQFRIEGTVANDVRRVGNETSFSIVANHVSVPVIDTKEPPQLFKPGIPVVLEGHWAAQGPVFDSDLVMVKHSASYAAAHPDRLKSQIPSTTVAGGGS